MKGSRPTVQWKAWIQAWSLIWVQGGGMRLNPWCFLSWGDTVHGVLGDLGEHQCIAVEEVGLTWRNEGFYLIPQPAARQSPTDWKQRRGLYRAVSWINLPGKALTSDNWLSSMLYLHIPAHLCTLVTHRYTLLFSLFLSWPSLSFSHSCSHIH